MFFTWALTNGIIEALEAVERAASVAICGYDTTQHEAPLFQAQVQAGSRPGAQLQQQQPAANSQPHKLLGSLVHRLGWAEPLVLVAANVPYFTNLRDVLTKRLSGHLSAKQGALSTASSMRAAGV